MSSQFSINLARQLRFSNTLLGYNRYAARDPCMPAYVALLVCTHTHMCEISHARLTVAISPVIEASCYTTWGTLLRHTGHIVTAKNVSIAKQVSLVHVTVITLIGLYTLFITMWVLTASYIKVFHCSYQKGHILQILT